MNPILRNILAVIVGIAVGSALNMSLIMTGMAVYPVDGLELTDPEYMEKLVAIMPNLETKYFVFPFLAHALGTLFGAIVAGVIAATHKMKFAMAIGFLFLIGGLSMNADFNWEPISFVIIDTLFAYIPMAWIGGKLAIKMGKKK